MDKFEGKKTMDKILWYPNHEFAGRGRISDKDIGNELWKLEGESTMEAGESGDMGTLDTNLTDKMVTLESGEPTLSYEMADGAFLPGIETVSVHAMGL